MTARQTNHPLHEMPADEAPRRKRVLSLRALLYAGMIFGGFGMMFAGAYGQQYADPVLFPLPSVFGTSRQQALRTVCEVTVLLGCGLLCLGLLCTSQLGKRTRKMRPQTRDPRPRTRSPRPEPASERPFENRLSQYLEEEPTPAARTTITSKRSFFLALMPGPRRGPKSASTIRAILLRIHHLLRGGQ